MSNVTKVSSDNEQEIGLHHKTKGKKPCRRVDPVDVAGHLPRVTAVLTRNPFCDHVDFSTMASTNNRV